MKAEEKRFLNFLAWHNTNFIVPVYQRNYDWKIEQAKQLFDDIIQVTKDNYRTHFMWTIVAYDEDWYGWKELLIIDWQQRLTTLSLLLLAIFKVLNENQIESEISKEEIHDVFLTNKFSKDKSKIRLKPVKDDREAFNSIFEWEKDCWFKCYH